jgi:Tfp pilus assembly protein PilF
MEALHVKDVLHRDLKPENILLTSDAQGRLLVKLVDFGLARPIREVTPAARPTNALKEFVGTIHYTSPENFKGEPLDQRSDIYSLGIILYEMLAGAPPFTGGDYEVEAQHKNTVPPSLETLRPEVPPELAQLVSSSLSKDPKRRPQSAPEFYDVLHTIAKTDEPPPFKPAAKSPPGPETAPTPTTPARDGSSPPPPQDGVRHTPSSLFAESRGELIETSITQPLVTAQRDPYNVPFKFRRTSTLPRFRPTRVRLLVVGAAVLLLLVIFGSCLVYPSYRLRRAKAHFERGVMLAELGEPDQAAAELDEAIELDPTLARAYFYRGAANAKRGESARALADYTEAIRLEPGNASAYRSRAEAYLAAGEHGKAVADYTQLLRLDPTPGNYKLRGDAHLKNKDFDKAIADYTQALLAEPDNVAILLGRGDAYKMKGARALAQRDYRSAERLRAPGR